MLTLGVLTELDTAQQNVLIAPWRWAEIAVRQINGSTVIV